MDNGASINGNGAAPKRLRLCSQFRQAASGSFRCAFCGRLEATHALWASDQAMRNLRSRRASMAYDGSTIEGEQI